MKFWNLVFYLRLLTIHIAAVISLFTSLYFAAASSKSTQCNGQELAAQAKVHGSQGNQNGISDPKKIGNPPAIPQIQVIHTIHILQSVQCVPFI